MRTNASAGLETTGNHASTDLEPRDVRALTEVLTVLPDQPEVAGADELYLVVSESGSEYTVDARDGSCTCPDHEYRGARCKHIRRVEFATGRRAIPAGVAPDKVDDRLGGHVDGQPRHAATDGGQIIEAGDEGEIVDDGPTYRYHREPPHVGGARYVRCEVCGAESVPADPERLLHKEGCPEGDR